VPFVELVCTPTVLSDLGLPDKLDEKHPYRYLIRRHSEGDAMLISQSHQHLHESFETEILIVGERRLLVEKVIKAKRTKDSWRYTLTCVRIYADPSDQLSLRDSLPIYLQDILADFRQRARYTGEAKSVALEVCDLDYRTRPFVERIPH
jgi:hypothetical protein